jgi:UPF0755 protein
MDQAGRRGAVKRVLVARASRHVASSAVSRDAPGVPGVLRRFVKVRARMAGERTEEERERAREERARRRAEQAGRQPGAEPSIEGHVEAPSAPVVEPNSEAIVEVPPPLEPSAPEASHVEGAFEAPVEPEPPDVAAPPIPPPPHEPLIPPSRRGRDTLLEHRRHRLRAHRASARTRQQGTRRLTRARVGALLALALAIAAVWFLLSLFQPFAGAGHGKVIVEIPKGSSSSAIGSILARDGVVSSGFFFELRAFVTGKRGELRSGRFQLKRDMSYSAAIAVLSKPPPAAIVVKVTIPEGYTRLQVAVLAREDDLTGSYLAASTHASLLDPAHYGAPSDTSDLEGFLFPATYEIVAGVPASRLVEQQLLAFKQRLGAEDVHRAHELGVTPYQLLTVASMVEREAQTAHDRPLIAAVIYNRLREGMPLGIDATIYYAVELQKQVPVYAQELTEAQLHISSPYNTRLHKGLPPTPISNPGSASIEAAAHPAHVPYLYYVAAADGCGEQAFSTTYAQFEHDDAAYQAAVKKNGGHPPTCKRK